MIVLILLSAVGLTVMIGSAMNQNRRSRDEMEFYHSELKRLKK